MHFEIYAKIVVYNEVDKVNKLKAHTTEIIIILLLVIIISTGYLLYRIRLIEEKVYNIDLTNAYYGQVDELTVEIKRLESEVSDLKSSVSQIENGVQYIVNRN